LGTRVAGQSFHAPVGACSGDSEFAHSTARRARGAPEPREAAMDRKRRDRKDRSASVPVAIVTLHTIPPPIPSSLSLSPSPNTLAPFSAELEITHRLCACKTSKPRPKARKSLVLQPHSPLHPPYLLARAPRVPSSPPHPPHPFKPLPPIPVCWSSSTGSHRSSLHGGGGGGGQCGGERPTKRQKTSPPPPAPPTPHTPLGHPTSSLPMQTSSAARHRSPTPRAARRDVACALSPIGAAPPLHAPPPANPGHTRTSTAATLSASPTRGHRVPSMRKLECDRRGRNIRARRFSGPGGEMGGGGAWRGRALNVRGLPGCFAARVWPSSTRNSAPAAFLTHRRCRLGYRPLPARPCRL
jgi:hypothetical protein